MPNSKEESATRWNLFARELEDILAAHDTRLGQTRYQVGIHQMKVKRLRQSLDTPKSFPTLNPDELDRVVLHYQLDADEQLRLRAAILATAVETMLMNRVHRWDALRAAEQVFPILVAALRLYADDSDGLGTIRHGEEVDTSIDEIDPVLGAAFHAIDRGTLALHLSQHVASSLERREWAVQARDSFQTALDELGELLADDSSYSLNEAWMACREEANEGHLAANNEIIELG